MSATADPLAAALRTVLSRRGTNRVTQDDLAWARQVREVAQILWMQAGEPGRLRSEDADRAATCYELARGRGAEKKRRDEVRARRLRLVPPPA